MRSTRSDSGTTGLSVKTTPRSRYHATVIAKRLSGFAIGVNRSHGAFRGFLPGKPLLAVVYDATVIAKPFSRVLPGAACGRAKQTADRRHGGIGNCAVPR